MLVVEVLECDEALTGFRVAGIEIGHVHVVLLEFLLKLGIVGVGFETFDDAYLLEIDDLTKTVVAFGEFDVTKFGECWYLECTWHGPGCENITITDDLSYLRFD